MSRSGGGSDSVRTLLDEWGVEPNRRFGQNFVIDPNTVRRIVELAGVGPGDPVVEIGPGTVLTGLVKRILPGAVTANVNDPKSLEATLTMLGVEGQA